MSRTRIVLLAVICFQFFKCISQVYPDAGLWSTFSLEHKLNPKLGIGIDEEFRLKENYSRVNLTYTNLGFIYTPISAVKISLIYRAIQKFEDDNTFSFRNRLMLDVAYKQKFGRMQIGLRHRLQIEDRKIYSSAIGKLPEYYSRLKIEIKYDFGRRILPFINSEIRYQIHDPRNSESDLVLHRIRTAFGLEYKINRTSSLGIYYLIQHEWNIPNPEQLYITGIQYAISI